MKYKVLIFFVIGICLYLVDTVMSADEDKNIFVSDQEILSLISAWRSQVGREPTDDELARIINNLIDEEILYREALLLGLDQEDTIIKRRLAQKISFLKEESIPEIPTTEELNEYYKNNKEKYYIESSFTFTHYYFSENNNSLERSQQALKALQDNSKVKSDPFYLGKTFANEPLRNINTNFGESFSNELMTADLAVWNGPFESTYGHHIVYINSVIPGYIPEIEEVLRQVEVDFLQMKREQAVKGFLNNIRSEYTIFINPDLKF
ncbi:MAG: peptidylprolyl isomerase [Proteobacteria bacterium]|nr:peptidylprolyl isomerase [Pseudomonadota bacterium]MDA1083190.1 peptidylprolyl isomerase [Pseudomonadota bacterium]